MKDIQNRFTSGRQTINIQNNAIKFRFYLIFADLFCTVNLFYDLDCTIIQPIYCPLVKKYII